MCMENCMNAYLIDFENVKSKGLIGIDRLCENDKVIIFYSENSDTISFEMHMKVMETLAGVEYLKVRVGGKNALDFQLCSMVGFLAAKDIYTNISIISNDKGFDKLHDFWNVNDLNQTSCTVFRSPTIYAALINSGIIEKPGFAETPDDSVQIQNTAAVPSVQCEIKPAESTDAKASIKQSEVSVSEIKAELTAESVNSEELPSDCVSSGAIDDIPAPDMVITKIPAKKRGRRPRSVSGQIRNTLLGIFDFEADDIEEIKECINNSVSKEDFHNSLAKVFKQQASELYKILRPKYLKLKALLDYENERTNLDETHEEPHVEEPDCIEQAEEAAETGSENTQEANETETEEAADSEEKEQTVLFSEINRLLTGFCSDEEISEVYEIVNGTDTKQRLYLTIVKKYKKDRGCEIYKHIKPEYTNLVKLKAEANA